MVCDRHRDRQLVAGAKLFRAAGSAPHRRGILELRHSLVLEAEDAMLNPRLPRLASRVDRRVEDLSPPPTLRKLAGPGLSSENCSLSWIADLDL